MPKYDVAVVGAGLGGLAAASLAARQNKKVIVLAPETTAGGSWAAFRKKNFVFSGPDLSFGFERGGSIQKFMESLGIAPGASVYSPCYQVALPGKRITLYSEQGETLEELSREFPDEIDAIARFYRDIRKEAELQAKGGLAAFLSRHRTARGFLSKYGFTPEFFAFLDVQSHVFFEQPVAALSLSSLITLCDSAPFMVHGGFASVAQQMVNSLLKNGGEIRFGVPFSEIVLQEGRPPRLNIEQDVIESDAVLLNFDASAKRCRIFMGIRDEVVPVSMLQHVLCLSDYSRPDLFFMVSLSTRDDEAAAQRGMRTLSVSFSSSGSHLPKEERTARVASLIPFLDDFLVVQEHREPQTKSFRLPEGISFKKIQTSGKQALLSRSVRKGIFMLDDGSGTPEQAFAAAGIFIDQVIK